ncbi:MAG: ParB/RepB/Spo0J family partition protein [Candidatus Vogelbacteria bacterium]|nr:ParB/RepB/Spo0J family partition protein [Candidatus Vogelbacteria bacterium]
MVIDENNLVSSNQSIFWIEVEKIKPNPFQPRRDFDSAQLNDLADSIRQYGVLQPLVATRQEFTTEDGGLGVEYELIAGERRLRASKLAGVLQVPVIIRTGEQSDRLKLELAIIENIQREDLNPVDRARAFQQLADKFSFKHHEIAKKVGKSREYVSNSLRILALPLEIIEALSDKRISEGHTRPLLMLAGRPEEQITLFKEIMLKKLSVRDAESISRKIAIERARKKDDGLDPEMADMEHKLTERLGTRVSIETKDFGGRVRIDFFSKDDLRNLLELISTGKISAQFGSMPQIDTMSGEPLSNLETECPSDGDLVDDRAPVDIQKDFDDPDLYSVSNFSV